jgi:hypothetical protein
MRKLQYLLAIGLLSGVAVVACGENSTSTLTNGSNHSSKDTTSGDDDDDDSTGATSGGTTGSSSGATGPVTTGTQTASPDGLAFYKASVHPTLASKCGGCHDKAGPGPNWLTPADPEASYKGLFSQGYVVQNSRIVMKGAHDGSTTNVLSATEIGTYNTWVGMEVKGEGAATTVNVLAKLGDCFDQTKFDAMGLGNMRTTQRTNNNNTNNITPWNENANNCTGCNNAACNTCHSADPATNFINSIGNNNLPADNTFQQSKLDNPAFITKYFGIGPDGKPIASDGISKKATSTQQAHAYTHPMFTMQQKQLDAIKAFTDDVIAKYAAGTCGK